MSKGRPNKKGLEFFSLEVNFISDIKIRKLIKYQSGGAVTVYVHLLCNIYENGYYIVWDNELPFIISESTGFDEAYISEVIKCCMNVGLIDKNMFENHKILTSIGIQIRYNEICKRANRTSRVEEFSLLNTKEEKVINSEQKALPYEENAISYNESAINSELTTQSKVKESKVDINTSIVNYLNSKTGKEFRASSKSTQRSINARLGEGYTISDFQKVIDVKLSQWGADPKMQAYLRPETLFGTKFESYLNEVPLNPVQKPKSQQELQAKTIFGNI